MDRLTARDALCEYHETVGANDAPPAAPGARRGTMVYVVFAGPGAEGRFLGLVTDRQIARHPAARRFVELLPTAAVPPVTLDAPLDAVLLHLERHGADAVAVVDDRGEFKGAITRISLLTALLSSEVAGRETPAELRAVLHADHSRLLARASRLEELHAASLRLLSLIALHDVEEHLLRQAIEALAELINARYGAIGIREEAGSRLARFVYTGIIPEDAARIGPLPTGRGLLGVVVHEDRVLRLEDMRAHPQSVGFPPHHPPMKRLLAVPVHHNHEVYGRVYLCDRRDGEPFSAEDEQIALHFADALALVLAFHRQRARQRSIERRFRELAELLSATAGESFFGELTLGLLRLLQVDYAFVGTTSAHDPHIIETIAFCDHGKLADNIEYQLVPETVCGSSGCKAVCYFPEGARTLYPEDEILREFGVESFVGHPLHDSSGRLLGLLAVMHGTPLPDPEQIQSALKIAAVRAAAELERRQSEAELRKLANIVEQTADSVLVTDAQGVIQYVNPGYERTTGYSRAEAIGRKPSLVKSGRHDRAFYERLWSTIRRGEVFRGLLVNRRRNGELYDEEKTITPLKDARGEVTHFVSTGKDVTERMRAHEALREEQERFRQLAENIRQVFWMTSVDKNQMLYVSPAYETIWGRSCRSLYEQPRTWLDTIHPEDRGRVIEAALAHQADGSYAEEYRIVRPDGTTRWILDRAFPVRDDQGTVYRIAGIAEDITERKQSEQALARVASEWTYAMDFVADALYLIDLDDRVIRANQAFYRLTGLAPGQVIGHDITAVMHPHGEAAPCPVCTARRERRDALIVMEADQPDNPTGRPIEVTVHIVRDAAGTPLSVLMGIHDLTRAREMESELRRGQAQLLDAQRIAHLGNWSWDLATGAMAWSEETFRIFGLDPQAPTPSAGAFLTAVHPDDRERIRAAVRLALEEREPFGLDFRIVRPDGAVRVVHEEAEVQRDAAGRPQRMRGVTQDITERREAEERLSFLAFYDPLTGLPNRALMLERLRQAMLDAERVDRLVAVMFLDLDRFKYINDTLGHHVGDALLKEVSARLKDCVRPGDTISRLGGDEFTLVLANIAHVDDVARVARKVLEAFAKPFQVAGHNLFSTTSIGITLFPLDVREPENLLRNADAAMYHAKASGGNTFQFFTAELNQRAERRLKIETALRTALERDELSLHYQPQVDTKTGRILGMEALARWTHPELGRVPPVEFIPVAEETGLILPIGEWVLREACRQIRVWHETGFPKLQVAVNISGKQLRRPGFAQLVRRILREAKLAARFLDLELTESLLMEDVEDTAAAMHTLHDLGVTFSVDDFGTGYSSLAYLKRFPIDILKIDRSFVRDIATDPNDVAIVKTVIAMAHTLGMHVVAEGVETYEQLEFLRAQGCDGSQGYYCSEPLSADTFTDLLHDWNRIRAGRCRVEQPARRRVAKAPAARRARRKGVRRPQR